MFLYCTYCMSRGAETWTHRSSVLHSHGHLGPLPRRVTERSLFHFHTSLRWWNPEEATTALTRGRAVVDVNDRHIESLARCCSLDTRMLVHVRAQRFSSADSLDINSDSCYAGMENLCANFERFIKFTQHVELDLFSDAPTHSDQSSGRFNRRHVSSSSSWSFPRGRFSSPEVETAPWFKEPLVSLMSPEATGATNGPSDESGVFEYINK